MSSAPIEQYKPLREDFQATTIAIIPATVAEAITVAKTLFASKLFDLQTAEQAVAKILAGAELGIPPVQSLNSFHIVKGKIMTHYSTIAAGIRRAGYDYRTVEHDDEICVIEFINRRGEVIGEHEYTVDDAKRQGTQNMEKLPKVMLFARCISQGAKMYVPEAFNGAVIYVHEERGIIEHEPEQFPEDMPDVPPGTSAILAAKVGGIEPDPTYNPFDAPAAEPETITLETGEVVPVIHEDPPSERLEL
jgi:hypothetical protein